MNDPRDPAILFPRGERATLFGIESLTLLRGDREQLTKAQLDAPSASPELRAQVKETLGGPRGESPYAHKLPVITQLNISNTVGCNLACSYCYKDFPTNAPRQGTVRSMSLETGKQAVDALVAQAQGQKRLALVFLGGEPLMQPELLRQVVGYGQERAGTIGARLDTVVYTNGINLDRSTIEWANGNDVSLIVSLDGPPALNDEHRVFHDGRPSSPVVLEHIAMLMAHSTHPMRRVRTVVTRPGNLVALHEYLFDLGFNDIWVQAVYDGKGMASRGDGYEHRALLEWYRALFLTGVVIRVNPIDRFLEGLLKRRSSLSSWYPCGAGLFLLGVDPGGRMSPCHHFLEESAYSLGHVSDGIPSAEQRAHLSAKVSDRSPCQTCWARHLCGGECYHRALTVSHDYDGTIEPVCDERRDLIRETLEVFLDVSERRPAALDDLRDNRLSTPLPNAKAYRAKDLSAYARR